MSSVVLVVQLPSRVQLYNPKDCSTPGLPVPHHFPKFAQVHVHYIGDAIQPSHPLMPSFLLPSIIPSIRDFSNELSVCIRWPKYWSFSFSISPSNEYSGLLSFKFDRFDLPAVQGTPRSLLQHHSSKASILWRSAFFTVQLSKFWDMTTGKTIALTVQTFVGRVMSLLFNTLSRFVIAFLPRNNHLLSSWLQSPSAVILESKKRKSVTTSIFSPSICRAIMDAMILVFLIVSLKLALSLSSLTLIKRVDLQCVNFCYTENWFSYTFFFYILLHLWFIIGYWIYIPLLFSRAVLFIHSVCNGLHLLTPTSLSICPQTISPVATTSLFSMPVGLLSFRR